MQKYVNHCAKNVYSWRKKQNGSSEVKHYRIKDHIARTTYYKKEQSANH